MDMNVAKISSDYVSDLIWVFFYIQEVSEGLFVISPIFSETLVKLKLEK